MILALVWSRKRVNKKVELTNKRFEGPERKANYIILYSRFLVFHIQLVVKSC